MLCMLSACMSHVLCKSRREGLTLIIQIFPTNEASQAWFKKNIQGKKPKCSHCGNTNITKTCNCSIPYYCICPSVYNKRFSVKVDMTMEHSKILYLHWGIVIYQFMTNIKEISSMELHRCLVISQRTTWFMIQRLPKAWHTMAGVRGMKGLVEVDETYVVGLEKNMHHDSKKGQSKKGMVVGIRGKKTGMLTTTTTTSSVPEATQSRLDHFKDKYVESNDVLVYADSDSVYDDDDGGGGGGGKNHESITHGVGEYVCGKIHTNGIESFRTQLEWVEDKSTFHQLSAKHLHRYICEFVGRLNMWNYDDAIDMMKALTRCCMVGKRFTYDVLVGGA